MTQSLEAPSLNKLAPVLVKFPFPSRLLASGKMTGHVGGHIISQELRGSGGKRGSITAPLYTLPLKDSTTFSIKLRKHEWRAHTLAKFKSTDPHPCVLSVAEIQALVMPPTAFPGTWTESWIRCSAANTPTSAYERCQCYGWQSNPPRYEADLRILFFCLKLFAFLLHCHHLLSLSVLRESLEQQNQKDLDRYRQMMMMMMMKDTW